MRNKMTLKEAREKKGIKQSFIAEQLGVSVQTVSNWETGKCDMRVTTAKKLCEILGVEISDIFFG